MKRILVILFLLLVSRTSFAQLKMEVWTVPGGKAVECEPIGIHILWENDSTEPLRIGPDRLPVYNEAVTLWLNGAPILRMPPPGSSIWDWAATAKDTLDPGERVEGVLDFLSLDLSPGTYQIKATADFSEAPEDYFHGSSESNTVEFTLQLPSGEDLNAWNYAQQQVDAEGLKEGETKRVAACAKLVDPKFVRLYPDSIYSAWVAYSLMEQPDVVDPAKKLAQIQESDNLMWMSVPDPNLENKSGLRDVSGQDYTLWQIEWANRILMNHPNFALADSLQLIIGVNNFALGKKGLAIAALQKVADKQGKQADWARTLIPLLP